MRCFSVALDADFKYVLVGVEIIRRENVWSKSTLKMLDE